MTAEMRLYMPSSITAPGTDPRIEVTILPGLSQTNPPDVMRGEETQIAGYLAEVPELPGCIADGPSKAEALAAAERVAEEWIETARELGREIPKPRGRLIFA